MKNIFDQITGTLPKQNGQETVQTVPQQAPSAAPVPAQQLSVKDVVLRWQKNQTPEDTDFLLKKMKPTISAAITSYAPGNDKTLAIKAANLTLAALKSYDPSYGTDPSTHVFHNLKRLNRIVNKRDNIMPISELGAQEARYVGEVKAEFMDMFDREPTNEELADRTGYSLKKIDKILNKNKVRSDSSMVNEESHNSMFSMRDVTDDDYFEYVYASVGPIDKKIMEWTSGMHGKPALANNMIAEKLHITPAAVSQRKARINQLMSQVRGLV